jgi:hypothetical protein
MQCKTIVSTSVPFVLMPRSSFGSWLVNAFTLRNAAQYHFGHPKTKEVKRMVNHAKEVIQKIEEVINK